MKIKLIFSSAVALMALSSSAAYAFDWNGFYMGLTGGYGTGTMNVTGTGYDPELASTVFTGSDSFTMDGALAGGQVGVNMSMGNGLVLGAVGDLSWTDIKGSLCIEGGIPGTCSGSSGDSYLNANMDWLGTARGILGFANGNYMVYGTAGAAWAGVTGTVSNIDGSSDPTRSDSKTYMGFAVGAGAQMMVTDNMSIGAEYLYVDLGKQNYSWPTPTPTVSGNYDISGSGSLTANIIRASVLFHY
ncbi:MAG TPA: outer membrane beta-barrel protein [Devosiaceae bacterium]